MNKPQPHNPLERKPRRNPLFQSSKEGREPEQPAEDDVTEETQAASSPAIPAQQPFPPIMPAETPKESAGKIQPPAQSQINLAGLPPTIPARRRNYPHGNSYNDQYKKISFSIDVRLLPYVEDYLSRGVQLAGNKTAFINQVFLDILRRANYPIDPYILLKPFVAPSEEER